MKGVIEIKIEIDQDSYSFYILIRCCPMIPSSSGLPDDVAFLMEIILQNFVPIMEIYVKIGSCLQSTLSIA